MNEKLKVLTVSIDVSDLSASQIEELQLAMEVQSEDYDGAVILNSAVQDMDMDELMEEDNGDSDNLH